MTTRAELVEMLDNIAAALRNTIAAHGAAMTEGDRIARSKLAADGAAMVKAECKAYADEDMRSYASAAMGKWDCDDIDVSGRVVGEKSGPFVSVGDGGAWVSAWVWISNREAGFLDAEDQEEADGEVAFEQGWGVFECGDGQLVIEADSDRDVFASNEEAHAFVVARAENGDPVAVRALARVNATIPTTGEEG